MTKQAVSEVQQIIKELCLMNNRFMNKVFENNIPAAELLLRIILKNDKIKTDSGCYAFRKINAGLLLQGPCEDVL